METVLLASGMIMAIFFLAASLVSMGTRDREQIAEIADVLDMTMRFNFSKGWVAESKTFRSRIWVSRWEDATYEVPDLMIFVTFSRPLPFPLVLTNREATEERFPFDTQFSRTKGMKIMEIPGVSDMLSIHCPKYDSDRCAHIIRQTGAVLARFGRLADERRALFQMGRWQIKISLDLSARLNDVKALYHAALDVAESVNTVDPH
ncbi:MAG TPA: hypothetical protein ENO00_03950 [Deltaproteobacteria bacterium]|nr:hypothetical protein [Deltaproteobacteria bacterium]